MAAKINVKTTFESLRTVEPIYTGGDVSAEASGKLLATCVDDDVLITNLDTYEVLIRLEGDGEPVTSLCLSSSGSHLVICSRSLSMSIYSINFDDGSGTATLQRKLKPHSAPVITTCIDETNSLLATGSADSSIKVWDMRGGFTTHTFHGHSGVVSALCFFRHSFSYQKSTGKRKGSITVKATQAGTGDGEGIYLASGGEDGNVRIWDLIRKKSLATLESHQTVVRSLTYSSVQHLLLSASRDQTLILWDVLEFEICRVLATSEVIESAGLSPDGTFCYAGGENGLLRVWKTGTGREITQNKKSKVESDAIVAIIPNFSEEILLSIHQDQTFRIFSMRDLKTLDADATIESLPLLRRISGNHDEIIDIACVGPDRSLLALATNTESIRVISVNNYGEQARSSKLKGKAALQYFGSDVALLAGHEDIIICLDVDWSGHWVATGAKDNTARLWRLDAANSSYICFAILQGHAESLGAIALPRTPSPLHSTASSDPLNQPPAYVLTGSQDRTIKQWDTSKLTYPSENLPHLHGRAVYTRVAHEKDINAIDVSPTSSIFASASQDRTIKIWSLEDGSVAGILRGHKRGVWSIRFSPATANPLNMENSSRGVLVSGSGDHTVKVWSLSTYTCLLTFEGHSNSVLKVLWLRRQSANAEPDQQSTRDQSQNQPIIASASSDTLVKLWNPYAPPTSDHLLATLDNHTDRVWALATPQNINSPPARRDSKSSSQHISLISGGADARLTFWTDTTQQTLSAARAEAARRIEQEQTLQNHIAAKNYREVIVLGLTLNHPARLLSLFQDLLNLPPRERDPGSIMGRRAVDEVLAHLSRPQLFLLLQRVRDWNTNARTAPVAQRLLHLVLKSYPARTFEDMARDRAVVGGGKEKMVQLLRALEVYTERQYRRMEELMDESWILDYTLREMEGVSGMSGEVGAMTELDGESLKKMEDVKLDGGGGNQDVEMI